VSVVSATPTAHNRLDVLAVLEVKEGPTLVIAFENDVTSTATIASVRTSFGNSTGAVEVGTACPSFARGAVDLDVVNKVGICHEGGA
jgi:hypothetical protein